MNKIQTSLIIFCFLSLNPLGANDDFSEVRFGIQAHDLSSTLGQSHERGISLNGEYLFSSPQNDFFQTLLSPHPHVGTSINSSSGTSMAYGGFSWIIPFQHDWFTELRFGLAIHNGKVGQETKKKKNYGTRVLFHTGLSLGYVFFEKHTLSVLLNHISNGTLAKPNPGFTDFGVRYGYRF